MLDGNLIIQFYNDLILVEMELWCHFTFHFYYEIQNLLFKQGAF